MLLDGTSVGRHVRRQRRGVRQSTADEESLSLLEDENANPRTPSASGSMFAQLIGTPMRQFDNFRGAQIAATPSEMERDTSPPKSALGVDALKSGKPLTLDLSQSTADVPQSDSNTIQDPYVDLLENHEELVRRAQALEHARTSTVEYATGVFISRFNGMLDRCALFSVVIGAFVLALFAISMLFELL